MSKCASYGSSGWEHSETVGKKLIFLYSCSLGGGRKISSKRSGKNPKLITWTDLISDYVSLLFLLCHFLEEKNIILKCPVFVHWEQRTDFTLFFIKQINLPNEVGLILVGFLTSNVPVLLDIYFHFS